MSSPTISTETGRHFLDKGVDSEESVEGGKDTRFTTEKMEWNDGLYVCYYID